MFSNNNCEPQFESAILALREAAKNAPANGDILINLACALVESGRAEKALGIMRRPNEDAGSVKGLNTAAVAMFQLGQLTQSVQTLQKNSDDSVASQFSPLVPLNRPLRRKPSKQVENKGLLAQSSDSETPISSYTGGRSVGCLAPCHTCHGGEE